MTRAVLTRMIKNMLLSTFDLEHLKQIRSLLNQGVLLNVFESAVDGAIESKEAEAFQNGESK